MTKIEIIKALARPMATVLGGIGVFVGLFVPSVSADKLWVAAALAGVLGAARTIDKIAGKQKP